MKKARLQKVVDHLRKVRVQIALSKLPEFRMADWAVLEEPGVFKEKKNLSCMTSACAIGHAAHLFKKQGFKLVIMGEESNKLVPVYRGKEMFDAVSEFFDLTDEEAEYLFHPIRYNDSYPTVSEVADRIEDFIHGIYDFNSFTGEKG